MRVRSQNAWPSLGCDLLSLTDRFDRLLPVGFYYKTFIRPRFLWPLYERVLRHAAGLGRVDAQRDPDLHPRKRHLHADVAVIGGGPAGCLAALEAAAPGARVVLVDDQASWAGTCGSGRGRVERRRAARRACRVRGRAPAGRSWSRPSRGSSISRARRRSACTRAGWSASARARRSSASAPPQIVVATGARERPAAVRRQRPARGSCWRPAILRLRHLHGVRRASAVVVVTDDDHGWRAAAELVAAGFEVVGAVDSRAPTTAAADRPRRPALRRGRRRDPARRTRRWRRRAAPASPACGQRPPADERTVACDLVAMATRPEPVISLLAQDGAPPRWDERLGEFVPGDADRRACTRPATSAAPLTTTLVLRRRRARRTRCGGGRSARGRATARRQRLARRTTARDAAGVAAAIAAPAPALEAPAAASSSSASART